MDEGIFLIKTVIGMALLLSFAVVVSVFLSNALLEKETAMQQMGKLPVVAVMELVGMQSLQVFPPQVEIFFLMLMVLNMVVMGAVIGHAVHGVRRSFETGVFAFFYMQVMDKGLYYVYTVLRLLLVSIMAWLMYMVEVMISLSFVVKGLDVEVIATVEAIQGEMLLRGIGVLIFMLGIGVLYGIQQYHGMHGVDFGLCVMGICLALGNFYKIPQFIGYKQVEAMVNAQVTMRVAYYMKQLRFLCPFSYINPYNIYHNTLNESVVGVYMLIGIAIMVVAGIIFWKREWREL